MAKEKGKVVLFGNSWSGRATVAKILVCGELKDCSLDPTDSNSECQTYVGRGWTVIDSMGFGEPLGGTVPDKYVRKIVIDFLNEVQGRYSHIIFVVDRADFRLDTVGAEFLIPIMWRTFLEIFKGGEENFVVVVTDETPAYQAWTDEMNEIDAMTKERLPKLWLKIENERDATIMKMFPECKHFLHTDFGNPDAEKFPNDGHAVSRIKTLEKFEKEMEEMFPAANSPWAEPEISKMGDAEIQEMAAKICSYLTSSPAVNPRE